MASSRHTPEAPRDDGPQPPPDLEPDPSTPRWVKLFAVAGIILALLLAVMLLTGHGPGRHMSAGLPGQPPSTGLQGQMRTQS